MNTSAFHTRLGVLVSLGAILTLASCGGGGGDDGAAPGTLSLQITDGPVETAKHVYVQFSGLELHAADGQHTTLYYCQDPADATNPPIVSEDACTTLPAPKRIDLLAQSGGVTEDLLVDFTLPSGRYNWIRLKVDAVAGTQDSYIVLLDDSEHELEIPSGAKTGLKLNRGFVVPAGGSADFTIDFDLRKSVHVTGTGQYMLRPTLRLADNTMTGAIAGKVNDTLMTVTCDPENDHPAVYVYEGSVVTPDDIDIYDNTPDPVTTASVKYDINKKEYTYKAWFLEPGTYTVAFTCNAGADDPTTNDALTFADTTTDTDTEFDTVTVTAKTVTQHNF